MAFDLWEQLPPIPPIYFFSLSWEVPQAERLSWKRPFLLPDTSELFPEERFAQVAFAWNQKALLLEVRVDRPFQESLFPNFREGDSIELFFDTRDLKTAKSPHRFCHHFVFLPQKVGEVQCREVTALRAEEQHPLCDPDELEIDVTTKAKSYSASIVIPSSALFGFDPDSFDRIGFTYRINRYQGLPQHFALPSDHPPEKQPHLWASCKLHA